MSHFPSAPPPGAYVLPTATGGNQAPQAPGLNPQQQYYQQQQGPAPSYGAPQHSQKSQGIGGMFNQAVTTGKPMFNKLSKQISSKLSGKQPPQATPQHLSGSYQNYHQQQSLGQTYQQPPHTQQQQWQQPPQPQVHHHQQQNSYSPSPQSPFPQSNYATPVSGNSGQSNYFPPQQTPQSPNPQAPPPQQPNSPGYNPNQFTQGQHVGIQHGGQPAPGQFQQGHLSHGQSQGQVVQNKQQGQHAQVQQQGHQQGQSQQTGSQPGQISEQQTTGVVGSLPSPHASMSTPNFPSQPNQQLQQQPQQQWAPHPSPPSSSVNPINTTSPSPGLRHSQTFSYTPPPQPHNAAPTLPIHAKQSPQSPQQQQPQPQQWTPVSPTSPQGPAPSLVSHVVSPPPPQTPINQFPSPSNIPPQPVQQQQQQHLPSPLVTPKLSQPSAPTEFIAELPGDMGTLNSQQAPSTPSSPYQAYQPLTTSRGPSPGHTIARRAVSMSGLPLADPWSIADAATELPTREFYIIADLLFDALDKKFEPQNTGILEASKILESWRVEELTKEVAQLFAHDSFRAFARLWSLEGIPHVMVPNQPSLCPSWDFRPPSHSHELKIAVEPASESQAYPSYTPALNRAGWYKYFFLEVLVESEIPDKMLAAFCSNTYKPNVLKHPDLQKRDRTELTALVARARAIRSAAIPRVCQEMAAAMQPAMQS